MASGAAAINTQDDDKKDVDENLVKIGLVVAATLISPMTMLATVAVYFMFSYVKIKRSVITVFSLPIFIAVAIFIKPAVNSFINSWKETFPSMTNGEMEPLPGILLMLAQQSPIGVTLGILAGLGLATWRWFTRARWKEITFRRAPWDILKYKKTVNKIKNDEDTPKDGMTLGILPDGNRSIQTTNEAAAHTFIVGGSGSGKTRTAMIRLRDQIKNNEGVIVVDLKADDELTNYIKLCCDRYGRKFKHFTLQDATLPYEGPAEQGNSHYDPISKGDHTRRTDMILGLRDWSNAEYFQKMSQSYFQQMFAILIANPDPKVSTLEDAINLMDLKQLALRAGPLAGDPRYAPFVNSIHALLEGKPSSDFRNNLTTNRSLLETFMQSVAGPWLRLDDVNGNNISLSETAYNSEVVVFSLDALAYGQLAADIANLIIQDLKTVASELQRLPADRPLNVFIDEFSAIGSDNILQLINKSRSAGVSVTLATQTLGDLMTHDPSLKARLMGIVSSFIIHRANTEEDAKVYAGLAGTEIVNKTRSNADYTQNILGGIGRGIGTGQTTVEEVEQWRIMPTDIQDLGTGEMFYINSAAHRREKVRVIIDDLANPNKGGTALALKETHTTEHQQPIVNTELPTVAHEAHDFLSEPTVASTTTLAKDEDMARPKKDKQPVKATDEQAFNEAKELEKVPINYDLLRSFFNDRADADLQEQEDIADGVISKKTEQKQPAAPAPVQEKVVTPAAPRKTFPGATATRKPTAFPSRPTLPARPAPVAPKKKDEFEF
jgi:hypothetical protein